MNTKRKSTNVTLTIIDTNKLLPGLINFCKKQDDRVVSGRIGFTPIGFVETKRGIYALNTEGVGPSEPISDNNPFEVEFFAEYAPEKEGLPHSYSCFPNAIQALNADNLKALATEKKVNLADFIRSFGARLKSNYEVWRVVLEKASNKDLTL